MCNFIDDCWFERIFKSIKAILKATEVHRQKYTEIG